MDRQLKYHYLGIAALVLLGGVVGFGFHTPPGVSRPADSPSPAKPIESATEAPEVPTGPLPTLEEVVAVGRATRYSALARFLTQANSSECAALYAVFKKEGGYARTMVLRRWGAIDPEAAMAANERGGLWAWAKSDPESAVAHAVANNTTPLAIRAIGQSDPHLAIDYLRQHQEAAGSIAWEGIVEGLAIIDPRAAIVFALEKSVGLKGAMRRWAAQDSDAALEFALALKDPRHRRIVLNELIAKLNADQPARAEEVIASLPPGRAQETFLQQWLGQLAITDFDQARTRAAAIDNPRARNDALYQLAGQVAFADPDAALELVAEAGRAANSTPQAFAHTLAHHRPQAALELAAQIGDGSLLYSVARHWVRLAPEAASQWILQQPPSDATSKMGNALIMAITRYPAIPDYPSATAWALHVNDSGTLHDVVRRWHKAEPIAAREAMRADGFPQDIRERVLNGSSP